MSKILFICFNGSLSNMLKNGIDFLIKALFISEIIKSLIKNYVLFWFPSKQKVVGGSKGALGRKGLISAFMTWQTRKQITTIHILPNISRSKGNKTMKFGYVIECSMTNMFLEKSYTKCGRETCSRTSYQKSKYSTSLDHKLKFHTVCFYYMSKWRST